MFYSYIGILVLVTLSGILTYVFDYVFLADVSLCIPTRCILTFALFILSLLLYCWVRNLILPFELGLILTALLLV